MPVAPLTGDVVPGAAIFSVSPLGPAAPEPGSAAFGAGRYAVSVKYWSELLAQIPPGSDRHQQLSAALERARRRAAVSLPR